MRIVDFTHAHVAQAKILAKQNYEEGRSYVLALPMIETFPDLSVFAENNMGVVAMDGEEMIGFMCAYSAFDNAFGTTGVIGIWSPLHAHAAVHENRKRIYREMYRVAADKWIAVGAISHAITVYTHDQKALECFFQYGFGLRCIDAIQFIRKQSRPTIEYSCSELPRKDADQITDLRNLLINHLNDSPCFLHYDTMSSECSIQRTEHRNSRIFTIHDKDQMIGFLEITQSGENFVCEAADMMNICGAYLLAEYRGAGVFEQLLRYTMNLLHRDGYRRIGVDFESFNPTAYGFWLKHFAPYTSSVVRRIDERGHVRPVMSEMA